MIHGHQCFPTTMHSPTLMMKALRRIDSGLVLEDVPPPRLEMESDVLVEVAFAGICRTDLYVADGTIPVKTPLTLGHELSGIVRSVSSKSTIQVGTRVGIQPWIQCGSCQACFHGRTCGHPKQLGVMLDGAFAEWLRVPCTNAIPLPSGVSFLRGALLEPVAAAMAPLSVNLEGRGVILGKNRISKLLELVLHAKGIVLPTISVEEASAPEHANSYRYVIESLATEASLAASVLLLEPGGVLVLKSRPATRVPFDVSGAVRKHLSIQAVDYGSFEEAASLLASLPLDDLIAEPIPLAEFETAFRAARTGLKKVVMALGGD